MSKEEKEPKKTKPPEIPWKSDKSQIMTIEEALKILEKKDKEEKKE